MAVRRNEIMGANEGILQKPSPSNLKDWGKIFTNEFGPLHADTNISPIIGITRGCTVSTFTHTHYFNRFVVVVVWLFSNSIFNPLKFRICACWAPPRPVIQPGWTHFGPSHARALIYDHITPRESTLLPFSQLPSSSSNTECRRDDEVNFERIFSL